MTTDQQTIRLPADPGSLDAVLDLMRAVAADAGIPTADAARLESAVMEVVENVIEHGTPAGASQLSVRAMFLDGWFRAEIEDDGPQVAVDLTTVQMPAEMAEGGRGLAMAAGLLDDFRYERGKHGNIWRLGVAPAGA